ncbi:MAG: M48 family metallopeptidase [Betaproteobacteria bacterium]|nr:M48 family metallopeptidase [Betaproteobacteria bacterium]
MILRFILAVALLGAPALLAQALPELGEPAQASFTPLQEKLLGDSIMREARRDPAYYDDPELVDYISRMGRRLAQHSGDARQSFEFFLMKDPSINAFALPGGNIGIHTGLITASQSESEVAGVMAHEIAHVTQRHIARMVSNQRADQWVSIAALAIAILAARSNSQLAEAASVAGPALAVQRQLNYSREFEREADRLGFQMVEKAGFDTNGMSSFFERLQRATRLAEAGAPAFLRTHPVTHERIADMQNRATSVPYRQVADSVDYHLMRAKLKAELEPPRETITFYREVLAEKRYVSEAGARYGLAAALLRAQDFAGARKAHAELANVLKQHPAVALLGCRIRLAANELDALACLRNALAAHPDYRALVYQYAEALLQNRQPAVALTVVEPRLRSASTDYRLYQIQSRAYAMMNRRLAHHRAQAEAYLHLGSTTAAVEQLQLGLKAGDGDYYQLSAAEARLRELRRRDIEERKDAARR